MKLLVVGSAPAVWGFSLAGIHGQVTTTAVDLMAALDHACQSTDIGVVMITSDVVDLARERVNALMARSELPLIIEIPGPDGPSPDQPSINEMLRRTIGVRL
ncbi:MAG: V-type ATP synthase subunit F [Anaerolineae bacterium]|nr:V-type ATP synthase subunit F [Anaerolineae bacterium]